MFLAAPAARLAEQRTRILIAQDDRVLADGLLRAAQRRLRGRSGRQRGRDADAALALHEFDLPMLDLGLPCLHGLDMLRKPCAR